MFDLFFIVCRKNQEQTKKIQELQQQIAALKKDNENLKGESYLITDNIFVKFSNHLSTYKSRWVAISRIDILQPLEYLFFGFLSQEKILLLCETLHPHPHNIANVK